MRNTLCVLEYGKKPDQNGKRNTHILGPRIWQETMKNVKNEKCTLQDLKYGEKTEKRGK